MNKRKNILFITGTRADYGLLKPVIRKMEKSSKIKPTVLVTGIHTLKKFGSTFNEIKKDRMPIVATVNILEKDSMIQSFSKEISGIANYCVLNKPDYIFVLGDRDEAFAGAVVGLHLNIPIIHFSGGDVSGPSVDHYLRNSITIFSKFHFVQTEESLKNVIKLGADPNSCFVVGSLGLNNLHPKRILGKEDVALKFGLDKSKRWFLISMHPTPLDTVPTKEQIDPLINLVGNLSGEKIIIYPNSDTGSGYFVKKINSLRKDKNIKIFENMTKDFYLQLLKNCDAILGNSSSGLTEAGFLKVPFVCIGNRQKNREFGANVVFSKYDEKSISRALDLALSPVFRNRVITSNPVYKGGDVADRVVSTLEKLI